MSEYKFETLQLHVGQEQADPATDARAVPIYQTTSYVFRNSQHAADRFGLADAGNIYGRLTNSTQDVFEKRIAALEGGVAALATASGAAAITYTIQALAQAGDHIVAQKTIYGGSYNLLAHTLTQFGVNTTFVDAHDLAQVEAAIQPNTKVLFLETPSNPLGEVADIKALAALAHKHGAVLIVDNCFCTPAVQQPIKLGADISLASATKGIDGHGRAIGGIVCGSNALIEQVWNHVKTAGEIISPFNAWLLSSGLETLFVRLERECANAMALAQWLEQHPKVEKVYYGGLESHPQHELAKQQQRMFGVVVAFEVKGARKEAWHVVDSVQLFSRTGNLGDVKSTITHPYTTTHCRVSEEGKAAAGITEGLLRLSIGLENVADLQADLEQALAGI